MVVTMVEIHIAKKMLARDLKMTVQHRIRELCLQQNDYFPIQIKSLNLFLEINGKKVLLFLTLIPTKIFPDVEQRTVKNDRVKQKRHSCI